MKCCFALLIFGAISTQIAQGSNHRRLQLNEELGLIADTEIISGLKALMVSREDPADAGSRIAPCSSPSAEWLKQQVSYVSDEDLDNFFDWHVYTLPFAYKLFVEPKQRDSSQVQEYFGLDGEYTEEINQIHEQALGFWAHSGADDEIHLLCAHGSDLADRHTKLIPTLEVLFGGSYDDEYTIFDHATDIQDLVTRLPGGYNYPLLTFNAFATEEVDDNVYPSIIIGDGYFEFQRSVGLASEGPEYALTHEHAHHLQFSLDAPEDKDNASQTTRRQELMADAFSAYFLAHVSGGDMAPEEISNIHTIAYSLGDCEMSNDGHHGTPRQRRCATRWGATIADSQEFVNLDLIELKNRFDAWYERVDELDDLCQQNSSAAFSTRNQMIYSLRAVVVLSGIASVFGF
ncbi:hypothetical protein ACHAXR_010151 [Thalassiosira sp. AJA248-18]